MKTLNYDHRSTIPQTVYRCLDVRQHEPPEAPFASTANMRPLALQKCQVTDRERKKAENDEVHESMILMIWIFFGV